eukprot:GILJ01004352.1.p1 GENE.GILJ01004352.1~~GILJ01004352.1.p1  ORF type:complete len:591 (-),score=93.69 GILJ01004352.1:286-2058(-)
MEKAHKAVPDIKDTQKPEDNNETLAQLLSLSSCLRELVNNSLLSDVVFLVGENRTPIMAHKAILAIRCAFFRAMFGGDMREAYQREVYIPNIPPDAFLALLHHLYTGSFVLNPDIAMDVMAAANQYGLDEVKRACSEYIYSSVDASNACFFLHAAQMHEAEDLFQFCFKFIEEHTSELFSNDTFLDLTPELLIVLLKSDHLNSTEMELFQAVIRWGAAKAQISNLCMSPAQTTVKAVTLPDLSMANETTRPQTAGSNVGSSADTKPELTGFISPARSRSLSDATVTNVSPVTPLTSISSSSPSSPVPSTRKLIFPFVPTTTRRDPPCRIYLTKTAEGEWEVKKKMTKSKLYSQFRDFLTTEYETRDSWEKREILTTWTGESTIEIVDSFIQKLKRETCPSILPGGKILISVLQVQWQQWCNEITREQIRKIHNFVHSPLNTATEVLNNTSNGNRLIPTEQTKNTKADEVVLHDPSHEPPQLADGEIDEMEVEPTPGLIHDASSLDGGESNLIKDYNNQMRDWFISLGKTKAHSTSLLVMAEKKAKDIVQALMKAWVRVYQPSESSRQAIQVKLHEAWQQWVKERSLSTPA